MAAKKQSGKVTTATLLRGRVYVHNKMHFARGVPIVVGDSHADELEALYDEVRDSDSDTFEKPYFLVQHNAEPPETAEKKEEERRKQRRRLRRLPAAVSVQDDYDEEQDQRTRRRRRRRA